MCCRRRRYNKGMSSINSFDLSALPFTPAQLAGLAQRLQEAAAKEKQIFVESRVKYEILEEALGRFGYQQLQSLAHQLRGPLTTPKDRPASQLLPLPAKPSGGANNSWGRQVVAIVREQGGSHDLRMLKKALKLAVRRRRLERREEWLDFKQIALAYAGDRKTYQKLLRYYRNLLRTENYADALVLQVMIYNSPRRAIWEFRAATRDVVATRMASRRRRWKNKAAGKRPSRPRHRCNHRRNTMTRSPWNAPRIDHPRSPASSPAKAPPKTPRAPQIPPPVRIGDEVKREFQWLLSEINHITGITNSFDYNHCVDMFSRLGQRAEIPAPEVIRQWFIEDGGLGKGDASQIAEMGKKFRDGHKVHYRSRPGWASLQDRSDPDVPGPPITNPSVAPVEDLDIRYLALEAVEALKRSVRDHDTKAFDDSLDVIGQLGRKGADPEAVASWLIAKGFDSTNAEQIANMIRLCLRGQPIQYRCRNGRPDWRFKGQARARPLPQLSVQLESVLMSILAMTSEGMTMEEYVNAWTRVFCRFLSFGFDINADQVFQWLVAGDFAVEPVARGIAEAAETALKSVSQQRASTPQASADAQVTQKPAAPIDQRGDAPERDQSPTAADAEPPSVAEEPYRERGNTTPSGSESVQKEVDPIPIERRRIEVPMPIKRIAFQAAAALYECVREGQKPRYDACLDLIGQLSRDELAPRAIADGLIIETELGVADARMLQLMIGLYRRGLSLQYLCRGGRTDWGTQSHEQLPDLPGRVEYVLLTLLAKWNGEKTVTAQQFLADCQHEFGELRKEGIGLDPERIGRWLVMGGTASEPSARLIAEVAEKARQETETARAETPPQPFDHPVMTDASAPPAEPGDAACEASPEPDRELAPDHSAAAGALA